MTAIDDQLVMIARASRMLLADLDGLQQLLGEVGELTPAQYQRLADELMTSACSARRS